MMRSSINPIIPMTNMATIILELESLEPFWNSSQTKEPKPGLCANNSIAINTIQATERVILNPVKIIGKEEGRIILNIFLNVPNCNTFATFIKSLSTDETPTLVFTSVAHMEHNPTLIKDITNDFSISTLVKTVFTIMETNNNHTTGDTGLNI